MTDTITISTQQDAESESRAEDALAPLTLPTQADVAGIQEHALWHALLGGASQRSAMGLSVLATFVLAACGGGDGDYQPSPSPAPSPSPPASPDPANIPQTDAQAAQFVLRVQNYVTDRDIADVRTMGYDAWLEAQLTAPQTEQTAWDWLVQHNYNREGVLYDQWLTDHMMWYFLMRPVDGVRKRVALAWSEIMVVSTSSIEGESPSFAMAAYWDLLMRHAFGNYRQLLGDISLNPAMGMYLNTRGNLREDDNTGRIPDENYAREVMQLFSIGLHELNQDGTPQTANGVAIESYNQDTVTNLARVFTGWVFDERGHVRATHPVRVRQPMVLNEANHSPRDVSIFGQSIAGSTPGQQKLQQALDIIFNHANVAPFIGRQLIQRLVTGNPSPQYVARVASAFNNNGAGVRGDLKAVTKAVLLDPEALDAIRSGPPRTFGKLREPMLRLAQWGATFGARKKATASAEYVFPLWNLFNDLGQSPLRSDSVFNFFRPGYVPPHTEMAGLGATAPEFQIHDEYTVARYINVLTSLVFGWWDVEPSRYGEFVSLANEPRRLVDRLSLLLAGGQIGESSLALIAEGVNAVNINGTDGAVQRVRTAIILIMACPEYIVQK